MSQPHQRLPNVFEHPYFAVTDDRGRFQMSELPEGRYQLEFQQPDLHCAGARPVVISNAQPATVHIAITAASIDQPNK